jgi:Skp family chaperone for outer membrane proteins
MKRPAICAILGTVIGILGLSATGGEPAVKDPGQTVKTLRVGMFDSRAVALAYYRKFYRSPEFVAGLKKLNDEHDKAEAAGDHEKAKKLEAEGKAGQERSHSQFFGSAPIDEIVAKIKDQIPEIAKQAGVDLIVSKWSVTYLSPGAEFVDVTEPMARLFQPDEETWKILREYPKHQPLSAEELQKHKDDKNF